MPQEEKKQIKISTGILIVLAAAVIIGGGAIAYFYVMSPTSWDYMGQKTAVHKSSNANTNTSNTNSATVDWKTYTNSTYGFGLTFPNNEWENYKIKKRTDPNGIVYIYVTLPTTDKTWNETTSADTGYASLIGIGVYTKDQWANETADPAIGTKKGENTKYVFTVSAGQDYPSDFRDNKTLMNSIKTLIDSFEIQ